MKTFPFVSGKNKGDFLDIEELADQICSAIINRKLLE